MVANQEMPSKNQVPKQPKSIDRICAELQLTADGVETDQKFVDIDDVIDKQINQSEDLKRFFDSDHKCCTSAARVSCDIQVKKMEENHSSEMATKHNSVEYSTPLVDVHSTKKMASTDVYAGVNDSSRAVKMFEVDDKNIFWENRVQEPTGVGILSHRPQHCATNMEDQRSEEEKRKIVPRHATQYNNWHYKDMLKAINAVQTKDLSMTAAAKRYQIPRTTLRHYLNDGTNREPKLACFSLPKGLEEELLQFVLDNRDYSEKELYKLIFEKARILSQVLSNGIMKKRHAPTPAWIRRFVYRHKQLHDLFPTCLTSEHPLHGGRKTPHEFNDVNPAYEPDTLVSPTRDVQVKCEPYSFLTRRSDVKGQVYVSEIIFPPSVYDKSSTFNSSEHIHTSDEYSYESEISHEDYDARHHHEDFGARQHRSDGKCLTTYSSYSMVTDEKSERNVRFDVKVDSNYNHVNCSNKQPFSANQVPVSVSHTSPLYNTRETHSPHDSCERFMKNKLKVESRLLLDDNITRHERHISQDVPNTITVDHSFMNSPIVRYDNTSAKNQSEINGLNVEEKGGSISELHVCKALLVAMENSIGHDFVQLFQERYSKNKAIERLYSQWVRLKSDLEMRLQSDERPTGDSM